MFRNPVQVYASIISSFGNNRLKNLYSSFIDLKAGPRLLAEGYKSLANKAIALNYEDFVNSPENTLRKITNYLEIDFNEKLIQDFTRQDTKGTMGDLTGVKSYKTIEPDSLDKWKTIFSNNYRKKLILNYIQSLDEETLKIQGYDKDEILSELRNLKINYGLCLQDRFDYFYSSLVRHLKLNQFFSKSKNKNEVNFYLS